jgi:hypothetical protein
MLLLLLLDRQGIAGPSDPVGSQFQVNSYTTGLQHLPGVSPDGAGGFVVVWVTETSSPLRNIAGQRYSSAGTPLGGEFMVNSSTTSYLGNQTYPAASPDGAGGFVVVWSGFSDSSSSGVFRQRYSSAGTPLGGEFQVNTYTTGYQAFAEVGPDGAGGFVVVWQGLPSGIHGQRYSSAGTPLGGEFQVNTYTTGGEGDAEVSPDGAGGFVVVWVGLGSGGTDTDSQSIQGQRYSSAGTPLGGQFQVNTYTPDAQIHPGVSPDGAGGFVVVWTTYGSSGTDTAPPGIRGQRYSSAGTRLGGEFQVNTYTSGGQKRPGVSPDGAGGFVVVWINVSGALEDLSVKGQRYRSTGKRFGSEFQANTYPADYLAHPGVSPDGAGGFVVVWVGAGSETDVGTLSVQGQRFAPVPATLPATSALGTVAMSAFLSLAIGWAVRRRELSGRLSMRRSPGWRAIPRPAQLRRMRVMMRPPSSASYCDGTSTPGTGGMAPGCCQRWPVPLA